MRERIAAVTAQLAESVAGMAVIQAYNREAYFRAEFDDLNGQNLVANTYAQQLNSFFFPAIEFLGAIASVACSASAPTRTSTARSRSAR